MLSTVSVRLIMFPEVKNNRLIIVSLNLISLHTTPTTFCQRNIRLDECILPFSIQGLNFREDAISGYLLAGHEVDASLWVEVYLIGNIKNSI
jgi:hypothetical protein